MRLEALIGTREMTKARVIVFECLLPWYEVASGGTESILHSSWDLLMYCTSTINPTYTLVRGVDLCGNLE